MPQISRLDVVGYALAAVVVVVLGVRFLQAQDREPSTPEAVSATGQPAGARQRGNGTVQIDRARAEAQIVHVAGAVRHPGVYQLPAGARVHEAVRRAGGARPGANVNAINLAAKVADGQQVVVPPRAAGHVAVAGSTPDTGQDESQGALVSGPPLSLNSATAEQLDTLDGVGPATARKIIEWRSRHGGFRSVQDLGQVPGIGPKRLAALKDRVQP